MNQVLELALQGGGAAAPPDPYTAGAGASYRALPQRNRALQEQSESSGSKRLVTPARRKRHEDVSEFEAHFHGCHASACPLHLRQTAIANSPLTRTGE